MSFSNNLQKNDRVLDTVSGRQGKVKWTPRAPAQRRTAILIDGRSVHQYLDVMQLRLIVDGKTPEETPPVDGTPPEEPMRRPAGAAGPTDAVTASALETLRVERARNANEMSEIEQRFRTLKAANEKLDRAIAVLTEQS